MDCRNGDRDMVASPRALRRITVWWRCNQDNHQVLSLTHAPARSVLAAFLETRWTSFAKYTHYAPHSEAATASLLYF